METLRELDLAVFRFLHLTLHQPWLDPVFWLITTTGLGHVQAPPFALALIARARLRRRSSRKWTMRKLIVWLARVLGPYAAPAFWAFVATGLTNVAIRQFVPRERPSLLIWSFPQEDVTARSFPSGHTITTFGIAVAIWLLTRGTERASVGRWALAWAVLVGVSRVYRGVHWPSDVLAGACLGTLWACGLHAAVWSRRKPA